MRIFAYEFVTGGGLYEFGDRAGPLDSLAPEGSAMVSALVADLARLDGVTVDVLRDRRFRDLDLSPATIHETTNIREEANAIRRLASTADWSIVIAPELKGFLRSRCRMVEQGGGRLLGPTSELVALLSDKHATAEYLKARGVNTPHGIALDGKRLPEVFPYPAVLKPRDGAGSQGIRLVEAPREPHEPGGNWRLEQFCPGTPASVACLCGPNQILPLMPCLQRLSRDGRFAYLGGSLPIEPVLAARAQILAVRALAALPEPLGYIGIDLVLGKDRLGGDDVVIEVNPRLTTSYIGYRAMAGQNLAAAMLAVASDGRIELSWRHLRVEFAASGTVRSVQASSL